MFLLLSSLLFNQFIFSLFLAMFSLGLYLGLRVLLLCWGQLHLRVFFRDIFREREGSVVSAVRVNIRDRSRERFRGS